MTRGQDEWEKELRLLETQESSTWGGSWEELAERSRRDIDLYRSLLLCPTDSPSVQRISDDGIQYKASSSLEMVDGED